MEIRLIDPPEDIKHAMHKQKTAEQERRAMRLMGRFVIVVEARTAPLGIPFAILVTLFGLVWGWKKLRQQPLLAFFFVTYLVATIFFAGWAIYWGGLPEFSEVGIID